MLNNGFNEWLNLEESGIGEGTLYGTHSCFLQMWHYVIKCMCWSLCLLLLLFTTALAFFRRGVYNRQGFSQDFRSGCPTIHILGELSVQFFFIPWKNTPKNVNIRVSKISNSQWVPKRHTDTPLAKKVGEAQEIIRIVNFANVIL